ncbi:tyrosine-type recombinase/integrase [Sporosarcina gallistercoris]|uniref:Tyrosine-type recombinase/integrase n=1 Tax=Sporosarcina gallistercoris TaxID=2762245 RepID=A0ABR8PFN7_9BACL|nr:tyrosine-type recombinase/integrase [Sporosarcina gallistercoris]MBD7906990.1 tyrosine-type recombinase/integrase [Sporosarcina gallistercoris]
MNAQLIDKFSSEYSVRLNPVTNSLYKRFVTEFFIYSNKSYQEVTARDIRNYIQALTDKGSAVSTCNTRLCGLKLFYRFLTEEGLVEKDPANRIPQSKVPDSLPYYLVPAELMQLREIVSKLDERAIIETLYSTGVRISELVAMKKEHVDWSERMIHIPLGKRKKGRIVLFTKECEVHLRAYLDSRKDVLPNLFVNPYGYKPSSRYTIQAQFRKYANQLEIKLSPHTLRHTFAAHLANKGMPLECIQTLMGHENLEQTKYYARLYEQARKDIYDEWM